MKALQRGVRAAGASAALVVGLTGTGLASGPAAVADTVMKATTAVNVRAGASTSSAVLGVLRAGATVTAVGTTNGWTKVSYNGRTAYVYSAYLAATSTPTTATTSAASSARLSSTTVEAVNVRTGPGLTYPVSEVFAKGRAITVTDVTQNGYTQLPDGRWISTAWITTPTAASTPTTDTSSASTPVAVASTPSAAAPVTLPAVTGQVRATAALMVRTTSGSDYTNLGDVPAGTVLNVTGVTENGVAQIVYGGAVRWVNASYIASTSASGPTVTAAAKAVSFALAQVGKAYLWGGNGPDAYDCSGLTVAAYKTAGISLPRTTTGQATVGTAVSMADLQVGDLVLYYSPISHVGIYIGDGKIVHAANPSKGVTIVPVTYMPFAGARRVA